MQLRGIKWFIHYIELLIDQRFTSQSSQTKILIFSDLVFLLSTGSSFYSVLVMSCLVFVISFLCWDYMSVVKWFYHCRLTMCTTPPALSGNIPPEPWTENGQNLDANLSTLTSLTQRVPATISQTLLSWWMSRALR